MAQVFISYAKTDRAVAHALAKDLEARGLTVWWDDHLYAGQNFRQAIVEVIKEAKAVIVIWSDASVQSDWVYDEAGLAHRQKKLVTTAVPNFTGDVPPGFGGLHFVTVTDREKLYVALSKFDLNSPFIPPGYEHFHK